MSRIWPILFALATAIPASAMAQDNSTGQSAATSNNSGAVSDTDRAIAEKMLGNGGRVTPESKRQRCAREARPGEILVCAPDQDQYRVQSSSELDPLLGTNDGRLTPPDVAGPGIFKGKATASNLCLIPPCPPEQPLIIDLSAIPEAPAGSEADKVAKGEMRPH